MLSPYNSLLWNPQSSLFLESALYLRECAPHSLLTLPISARVQSMFLISFENRCIVDFFHLNLCYPSLYFHAFELESLVHHSIAQSRHKAWKYWAERAAENMCLTVKQHYLMLSPEVCNLGWGTPTGVSWISPNCSLLPATKFGDKSNNNNKSWIPKR